MCTAGIRLLSFYGTTDIQEATALNFKYNNIDIYSNSWGPHDTGYTVQRFDLQLVAIFTPMSI